MTERAAQAARSVLSARSLAAATASAVRRRGLRWPAAAASAAARGLRWLAAAASAAARGLRCLAAAASAGLGPVSGPAFLAAVVDPVAVSDPVAADAVAADCRLLVLDRSSVHVRAQRAADCHQADPCGFRKPQIRAYRWCSPPRIGCAIMSPNRS